MQVTPARVVAFLTPVFSAVSAVGTGWLAKHFPGLPHISTAELVALEGAGATAALGAALKFLHGQSAFERDALHLEHYAAMAVQRVDSVDPGVVGRVEKGAEQVADTAVAKVVALVPAVDPTPAPEPVPVPAPAPAPVVVVAPAPAAPEPPAAA